MHNIGDGALACGYLDCPWSNYSVNKSPDKHKGWKEPWSRTAENVKGNFALDSVPLQAHRVWVMARILAKYCRNIHLILPDL